MDDIKKDIKEINASLKEMDKTLVKQQASLDEHIRRTELAERSIEKLSESLSPIQKHVNMVEGALKALGVLSIVVGIVAGLMKIFR